MPFIQTPRGSKHLALAFFGIMASLACEAAEDAWYLNKNQIALTPGNRYYAALNVINPTNEPIFIRSSVDKLSLVGGERIRTKDTDQGLTISPEEFVVPPKKTVELRVFAKAGMQAAAVNQSYYVNLVDASHTQSSQEGAHTGFILAYDFLVAVSPLLDNPPATSDFSIKPTSNASTYAITNGSSRHVFLNEGYACQDTQQALVDCQILKDFPKQSLLPAESLSFRSTADMKVFGFLMYDNLNLTGLQRAHLQPIEKPDLITR